MMSLNKALLGRGRTLAARRGLCQPRELTVLRLASFSAQ